MGRCMYPGSRSRIHVNGLSSELIYLQSRPVRLDRRNNPGATYRAKAIPPPNLAGSIHV